jgi:hypothetical protein
MANSTTNLDLISSSQAQKEITANALFDAASPATLGGRRASTTTALTWGYYGGNVIISGTVTPVSNGTVTLTDNTTNYLQISSTGVVSCNTTGFGSNTPLYLIVTSGGLVTTYTDERAFLAPISGSGYVLMPASTTNLGGAIIPTSGHLTVDGSGNVGVPLATNSVFGVSKVDGTTIQSTSGVLSIVGGSGTVSQIVAGTGITISPSGGTGVVTINSSGGGGGSSNIGANIVKTGYPLGSDNNYADYTYGAAISGYDIMNIANTFTFNLWLSSTSNIIITGIVIKKTLVEDTAVIGVDTIVTIGGNPAPTITIPSSGTLFKTTVDPVTLAMDSNHDYWIYIYFSALNSASLDAGKIYRYRNTNILSEILGFSASGNHLTDTTISLTKTQNYIFSNLKVVS